CQCEHRANQWEPAFVTADLRDLTHPQLGHDIGITLLVAKQNDFGPWLEPCPAAKRILLDRFEVAQERLRGAEDRQILAAHDVTLRCAALPPTAHVDIV